MEGRAPSLSYHQLAQMLLFGEPALSTELHGFSDASEAAYSAVIYIRSTYANSPPTCRLVMSKTKVAPVKTLTIPRLELCGATLLAKILSTTRDTLNIPLEMECKHYSVSMAGWCP